MRGWGRRRPALRDPEYTTTANAEVMVIPQVETELALQNIEDIVTTDGVDSIFVGPMDLSLSLGVFQQFDNPRFLKAIDKIISACKAHNVSPGLLAPAGPVEKSIQQGFKMIQLGGDTSLLTGSVSDILKDAKAKVNGGPE